MTRARAVATDEVWCVAHKTSSGPDKVLSGANKTFSILDNAWSAPPAGVLAARGFDDRPARGQHRTRAVHPAPPVPFPPSHTPLFTATLRVLLNFTNASDHVLEETVGHVLGGPYGNASFPSPPVPDSILQGALTAFTAAIAAQKQGGSAATAAKQVAVDRLIGELRQLALYVQTFVQGIADPAAAMAALHASGFDAVSTNRA